MSSSVRLRTSDCQLYIAFGAGWAPFGGRRDEVIFPMFGVVLRVLFERLVKIISSHEAAQDISLDVRTRIVQSCAPDSARSSPKPSSPAFDRRPIQPAPNSNPALVRHGRRPGTELG
jgi:hypothetical protein